MRTRPFLPALLLLVAPATALAEPTVDDARAFLQEYETTMLELSTEASRAAWLLSTYIHHDSQILAAKTEERAIAANVEFAVRAAAWNDVELPDDLRRQLDLIRTSLDMPAPRDPAPAAELSTLAATMNASYGAGSWCPDGADGDDCRDLEELSRVIAESRDADELLAAWTGWRTTSMPQRERYRRFVELTNQGARELGFDDTGSLWRSKYDMDPDAFEAELNRLWGQLRPLYEQLHCHVRARLNEKYGDDVVPPTGPIPAHVLGNMWAQSWENVYELVAPETSAPGVDLTERLKAAGVDELEMVRIGERFFTSLGFEPLPQTFWDRSLFTKPADRDVVCHASAWVVDQVDDLRIKMCIEIDADNFRTIHHELGHNFYQRAYNGLPLAYRGSANDGFHEAIGDTIALSVTPKYLMDIDLIDEEPPAEADLAILMRAALDKVAFLPFGLLVDQWRWDVFSGETGPDQYNTAWWKLREEIQGIRAPAPRTEEHFDAGAKYHVPANTPYTRYFLAGVLQFQLHRELCRMAGIDGPLHRCSIYGDETAGEAVRDLLAAGMSRPWPDTLEAAIGQREMDATAILDYFEPLGDWLEEQNAARTCGW